MIKHNTTPTKPSQERLMITNIFEPQLTAIIEKFDLLRNQSANSDLSDLPKDERQGLVSRAIAAITRASGAKSIYMNEVNRILSTLGPLHAHTTSIIGVVKALRDDLSAGYTKSLVELVHDEVFCDYLEMSEHLCKTGYKDAAAVIAGSTLESHLRNLCYKSDVPTVVQKQNGSNSPKKADAMNTDLCAADAYGKLDQKSLTAFLDLRNKAAHGEYDKYTKDQVEFLIVGIRDFICRNPA
jgi:hypothetical protein